MKKCLFTFLMIGSFQMAHASPFAYVTNYLGGNISVVDLATNTTIGYVDNGAFVITNPVDVRHSRDGTKAYLLADFNNEMFVIDTSTNAIVSQVDSSTYNFDAPNIVRFTMDGTKAYVTNEGGNNVSIIDVATDTITGYIDDPFTSFNLPIDVEFTPDGTLGLVVNYNGNSVSIFDVDTDTVIGVVDTSEFPLLQPVYVTCVDNTKAYVTSLNSAQIGIIDIVNQTMLGYIDSGPTSFVLPFAVLSTSDGFQGVAVDPGIPQGVAWLPSADVVSNVVDEVNSPRYFAISSDDELAYVADVGANTVYVIDLSTYMVTSTFDDSMFPFNIPYTVSVSP